MLASLALLGACWLAAGAGGASSSIVVSLDVPSATSITNNCTSTTATRFGMVLPGAETTTATGAGACSITFSSSNDTAALRLGTLDGASVAMSSPSVAWTSRRTSGLMLRTVDRSNANTVLIGGYYGLVARSLDGGTSWDYDYSTLPSGDYVFDVDHAPGSNDVFVTVGGKASVSSATNVTTSAPANPTWTSHTAALVASGWGASEHVSGVAVASASTWFLSSEQGRIARTTNGGTSFTSYLIPGVSSFLGIDALDANTVYATGSNAALVRTTTGGPNAAAWTTATSPCNCWYANVSVGDATHVYVASDNGTISRWDGSAFVSHVMVDERTFEPRAISSPSTNPDVVYVASMFGKVFRSSNSGASFTRQDTPSGGALRGIHALTNLDVMAVGTSENVVRTINGSTWSLLMEDAGHRALREVVRHPSDGQKSIAVGARGAVVRTSDGAASWATAPSGTTAHLNGVAWPQTSRVVAVGSSGTIIVSTDGGATWSPRTSGTSQDLLAVANGDHETLWAVGTAGTILRSTNRGDTWSSMASGTTEVLESVDAWGTQAAVASGQNGAIRRTANGGSTWSAGTGPPAWEYVNGVAATSATTFYVGTLYSGIYRSTDGGATFTAIATHPGDTIDSIAVFDDTIATLSRWGDLTISRDQGTTWTTQFTAPAVDFNFIPDFELLDSHTIIVVDDLGGIQDQDENSLAASQVADYAGGANFASADTSGTFGVCLQSLASAAPAGTWVADGGTCTAVDSDPWKAVPTAPQSVATAALGVSGTATFVWGLGPRLNQPPGTYRAGIVFEAIAPAV